MRGRSSVHLEESEEALRQAFNWRWKRSTMPLAHGWYAVVRIRLVPRRFVRAVKRDDSNCVPRSVVTVDGTPKVDIQ